MSINLSSLAKDMDFSQEDIQHILDNLDSFSPEELSEIDSIVGELSTREINKAAHDDLIEFCKRMQPDYKVGRHHRILANMLMDVERGPTAEDGKDRVCEHTATARQVAARVNILPSVVFRAEPRQKSDDGLAHN